MSKEISQKPIVSLFGKEMWISVPQDEAFIKACEKRKPVIENALSAMEAEPDNPVNYILAGMLTYFNTGDVYKQMAIYDKGLENCPNSYVLYAYRSLVKISLRDFSGSIEDGEKAIALIREGNVPDHGFDMRVFVHVNPTNYLSTSFHGVTWYHLGLVYYLAGDLVNAKRIYTELAQYCYGNDSFSSRASWFYRVLRELGEKDQAAALLNSIDDDINLIKSRAYRDFCLLFKGTLSLNEFQEKAGENGIAKDFIDYTTAYWHFDNGDIDKAIEWFRKASSSPNIENFAQLAAEAKLKQILDAKKQ